jgi:hypothetical protein
MSKKDALTPSGPLELFSLALVSKEQAVDALRLRDYSELLIALGAAGLSLPVASETELDT